jgi:hypothetical protein
VVSRTRNSVLNIAVGLIYALVSALAGLLATRWLLHWLGPARVGSFTNIHFPAPGSFINHLNRPGNTETVDIVPDLLSPISVDSLDLPDQLRLYQIRQESVEFNTGMIRASRTTGTGTVCLHAKVPAVLLHNLIGSDLAGSEN